jgi:hypothetical protein
MPTHYPDGCVIGQPVHARDLRKEQCTEHRPGNVRRRSTSAPPVARKVASKFATAVAAARTSPATAIQNAATSTAARRLAAPVRAIDFEVLPDPDAGRLREQVQALGLDPSCDTCPSRRVDMSRYDESYGYCDRGDNGGQTCDKITRQCPSCGEDKPMKGWGGALVSLTVGAIGSTPKWVCPDCRADRDTIERRNTRGNRFTYTLDVPKRARYALLSELDRPTNGLAVGEYNRPLMRVLEALKEDGDVIELDIDLSDNVDQRELDAFTVVLRSVRERTHGAVHEAAYDLQRAWVEFAFVEPPKLKTAPRPLSVTERSALTHGERPIG